MVPRSIGLTLITPRIEMQVRGRHLFCPVDKLVRRTHHVLIIAGLPQLNATRLEHVVH